MTRKAREAALRRRAGPSPEAQARLNEENAKAEWTGTCRCCGERVQGTMAEVRAHKCEEHDDAASR